VVLLKVRKCDSPSSLNPGITYGNQEETGSGFVWSHSKCRILIWWKGQQYISYVSYVNAHHHNWAQTALFTGFRIEAGPSASSDLLLETNTKPTSIILICMCVCFQEFIFFIHLCTCAYVVWVFLPCSPPTPSPPRIQAKLVLPLSLILVKRRHKHNKKDKAFLLVQLRTAA
jgi:hypothetical protein